MGRKGRSGNKETRRRRCNEGVDPRSSWTQMQNIIDKILANKARNKKDSSSWQEAYSRNAWVISPSKHQYIYIIYHINNIKEKSCMVISMRENNIWQNSQSRNTKEFPQSNKKASIKHLELILYLMVKCQTLCH